MYSFLALLLVVTSQGLASARRIDDDVVDSQPEDFDALIYLEKAGYLDDLADVRQGYHAPDNVKQALKEFQDYSGLAVTGRLDKATVAQMKKPRCGFPDVIKPSQRPRNLTDDGPLPYVLDGRRWYKNDLTYKWNSYSNKLPQSTQRSLIAGAFKKWADVTPLTFTRRESGIVEIDVAFGRLNHGDYSPFDGPGGILAHGFVPGYTPLSGDLHFDSDEQWTATGVGGVSLSSIAAHEIGHSLGLAHSRDPTALMYAFYNGHIDALHQDDINGIQAIYGRKYGK